MISLILMFNLAHPPSLTQVSGPFTKILDVSFTDLLDSIDSLCSYLCVCVCVCVFLFLHLETYAPPTSKKKKFVKVVKDELIAPSAQTSAPYEPPGIIFS